MSFESRIFMMLLRSGASLAWTFDGGPILRLVLLQAKMALMVISGNSLAMSWIILGLFMTLLPTLGSSPSICLTIIWICSDAGLWLLVLDFGLISVNLSVLGRLASPFWSDAPAAAGVLTPCLGTVLHLLGGRSLTVAAWASAAKTSNIDNAVSAIDPTGFSMGKRTFNNVLATSRPNFRG